MPAISFERIPLPSLQTYTTISVVLLAVCFLYAHQTVTSTDTIYISKMEDIEVIKTANDVRENVIPPPFKAPDETRDHVQNTKPPDISEPDVQYKFIESVDMSEESFVKFNVTLPYDNYIWNMLYVMTSEVVCVWILVNTVYCALILIAKAIQKVVFGELRVSEKQHLKDKFWNFVFYKFIFVFGVMNVQTMEEVVLWVAWFSSLGFFHLMTQLSKDRFEYLSFSPTTPRSAHMKLLVLLFVVLFSCAGLMAVCIYTGFQAGLTIFLFMAAECILLGIRTLHVLVRYFIHLYDMNVEGVWENRSTYVYFMELIFELAALSIDFMHHSHMLLWGNIFLSMASLVIFLQLRYLFYEFQRRIKRHKNYLRVVKNMDSKFPMATAEELEKNADNCAICWERMDAARKLPCGHLFHNACLRSSLEQDTACPTCRMSLGDNQRTDGEGAIPMAGPNIPNDNQVVNAAVNQPLVNHFFHFDASRYISWLPSFSVEVTHTSLLPGQQQPQHIQTSQLDNMARQVQNVFPSMPLPTIMDDLRVTRSEVLTIDNILEGRLVAPPATSLAARTDATDTVQIVDSLPAMAEETIITSSDMSQPVTHHPLHFEELPPPVLSSYNETGLVVDSVSSTSNDDNVTSGLPISGGRFSKSSAERMDMLNQRKSHMMTQARRRYLSKSQQEGGDLENMANVLEKAGSYSDGDSTDEDTETRRSLILEATERRLNSSQSDSSS